MFTCPPGDQVPFSTTKSNTNYTQQVPLFTQKVPLKQQQPLVRLSLKVSSVSDKSSLCTPNTSLFRALKFLFSREKSREEDQ